MIKIVQCWDDGVEDDIHLCEILRAKGARATFNLNSGLHGAQRGNSWRYRDCKDVYRLAKGELVANYDGFTIANHSVSHPRPTQIPIAQWKSEVEDGRKQLQDIFGQEILGFAYPFGDTNPEVMDAVREAGHVYARGVANATPCFPPADPMHFLADCHFASPDFWDRYKRAKSAGSPVFYFWGHSYEMVTEEDWNAFSGKLDRINADPDAVWANLPDLFCGSQA
ncbi:MAG: polysaccharide deacetylase family protein [Chthoniobacteraceae bacterium]|nr:polysaccharide deacetylase family protein [Chthoniobacteraceae bacterium]